MFDFKPGQFSEVRAVKDLQLFLLIDSKTRKINLS